ncbi:YggT family protein [Commensalibacter oyaizuii]|uniref:YggT family protein n=1 Tax=Commensalibacter oyaizuii TaxID=3043873 RepID=A0ABT6Q235_9PROT|nr:YggT family protein [Commensalibacter sp. TBRC 16381]MDI2091149.1 YggT family protein [Commensalibacter sp. TBRC 16381]
MMQLYGLIDTLLNVYTLILLLYCVFSFLHGFGVVNIYNGFMGNIYNLLSQLCDPPLNAIRQLIPNVGMMDFSPAILLMLINFLLKPLLRSLLF